MLAIRANRLRPQIRKISLNIVVILNDNAQVERCVFTYINSLAKGYPDFLVLVLAGYVMIQRVL